MKLNPQNKNGQSQPLISIIIPVYNGERFLVKCLDSLLAQTYTNLQIILIDDGSTDKTGEIADRYAQQDPRVEVIHQANAGVSAARNVGLKAVRGEYIGFVDCDDYVAPTMYEYLYGLTCKHQTPVAVCNFYNASAAGIEPKTPDFTQETRLSPVQALQAFLSQLSMWNKLFAAPLFQTVQFDPACGYGEDMPVCLTLFEKAGQIAYGPKPQYYYCRHEGNVTSSAVWNPRYLGYFSNTDILLNYARQHQLKAVENSLLRSRVNLTVTFLRRCLQTVPFDKQSARWLQAYIRKNLLLFLLCVPAKPSKKLFALCAGINLAVTRKIYSLFTHPQEDSHV